jgi:NDP-sugar pyrophosphorylase family protein
MIFAAGRGTRLGAVGEQTPKALLEVGGVTMLERTIRSLVAAGADRIIVNVHHHADRITRFLREHDLGVETLLSLEPDQPLETGGGLLHARALFRGDAPFFLHNVDVITDAHLADLYAAHSASGALATLATNERPSPRRLLFDEAGLFGREDQRRNLRTEVRTPRGEVRALAFAGIHVVAPELLTLITERGVFSVLDPYLRLAGAGHRIAAWSLGPARWLEIGTPERLEAARAAFPAASG